MAAAHSPVVVCHNGQCRAVCSCGWEGVPAATVDLADNEAATHETVAGRLTALAGTVAETLTGQDTYYRRGDRGRLLALLAAGTPSRRQQAGLS